VRGTGGLEVQVRTSGTASPSSPGIPVLSKNQEIKQ